MNCRLLALSVVVTMSCVLFGLAGDVEGDDKLATTEERPANSPTVLGKSQDRFTLNGEPRFLAGISYYAGLGASHETVRRDLDDLQRFGFNWLRVWATRDCFGENVAAMRTGNPVPPTSSPICEAH